MLPADSLLCHALPVAAYPQAALRERGREMGERERGREGESE